MDQPHISPVVFKLISMQYSFIIAISDRHEHYINQVTSSVLIIASNIHKQFLLYAYLDRTRTNTERYLLSILLKHYAPYTVLLEGKLVIIQAWIAPQWSKPPSFLRILTLCKLILTHLFNIKKACFIRISVLLVWIHNLLVRLALSNHPLLSFMLIMRRKIHHCCLYRHW